MNNLIAYYVNVRYHGSSWSIATFNKRIASEWLADLLATISDFPQWAGEQPIVEWRTASYGF